MARKNEEKATTPNFSLPIFNGPDRLPFLEQNFSWERFEHFCLDLLSLLYPEKSASIMGVKGDKQFGIDISVEGDKGLTFSAQCKRYKSFTLADYISAKKALKLKSNRCIIMVGCDIGSNVRLESFKDENWEIWDRHTLTSKVQDLKKAERRKILKHHFGIGWAKAFCDYNEHSCFITPHEFFRRFLDSSKAFNYKTPFFGREATMSQLMDFVAGDKDVFILSGRGGIGKSKVLWELSKELDDNDDWRMMFVLPGKDPKSEDFEQIECEKVIFVFDDGHRMDFEKYVSFFQTLKIKFKIVISTRPQALEQLNYTLNKLNFESGDMINCILSELEKKDVEKLIPKIFPDLNSRAQKALSKIYIESPLVGTLAINLIKKRKINFSMLSKDPDIKNTILGKFIEEVSGKLSSGSNVELTKNVLNHLSAVAPVNYSNGKVDGSFKRLFDCKDYTLNRIVSDLLASGIIKEQGDQIRVSPDVLSDLILEKTCCDSNGNSIGFFEELSSTLEGSLLENLIRNVSELDWKNRRGAAANTVLLGEFWLGLVKNADFKNGEVVRSQLAHIKPIAYFQPIESLDFYGRVVSELSNIKNNVEDYTFSGLLKDLTDGISRVAFTGYKSDRIISLLWDVSKFDDRTQLHSYPDHPLRRIKDLCTYDQDIPVMHYKNILEGVLGIIQKSEESEPSFSPIKFLEGFLAKTSESTYSDENSITISPFFVSVENTREIRLRSLSVLKDIALSSGQLNRVIDSIKVLETSLEPARINANAKLRKSQDAKWGKDRAQILNILGEVFEATPSFLVRLEIRRILSELNRRNFCFGIALFLESIGEITIEEMSYIPFAFWRYERLIIKDLDYDLEFKDYELQQKKSNEVFARISKAQISNFEEELDILKFADNRFNELLKVLDHPSTSGFSNVCADLKSPYAMCKLMLGKQSLVMSGDYSVFLTRVRADEFEKAFDLASKVVKSDNRPALISIAHNFWWIFKEDSNRSEVKDLFESLLNHEIDSIQQSATFSLRLLREKNAKLSIDLIVNMKARSSESASMFLEQIDEKYGIDPKLFSDDQLRSILTSLKDVESLNPYRTQEFLELCAKRIPLSLVEFIIERIKRSDEYYGRFSPLPFSGLGRQLKLQLKGGSYQVVFDQIADGMLESKLNSFWYTNFFNTLALGEPLEAAKFIKKLLMVEKKNLFKVGLKILREYPCDLIHDDPEFVKAVVYCIGKNPGERGNQIEVELLSAATLYGTSGLVGETSIQHTKLLSHAGEMIENTADPLEVRFYEKVRDRIIERIESDKKRFERRAYERNN